MRRELSLPRYPSRLVLASLLTLGALDINVSGLQQQGLLPLSASPPCALAPSRPQDDRDRFFQSLIERFGGEDFQNPPDVRPTTPESRFELRVAYATASLAGCLVHLRSYNGRLVGATVRAKAGETLYMSVVNDLPEGVLHPHPQAPAGHAAFSFNLTNLHTHGLHTRPQGTSLEEGDNVLLEIQPGKRQNYSIGIPAGHPSGTYWYHPHLHGSTAVQVSSGMAGALIVESDGDARGGLDTVPAIAATRGTEKIFVLQQFSYGEDGAIEAFDEAQSRNWLGRGVMVNGQLAPVIRMRPGEVQRWRFIHAGVEDNIQLSLDGHKLHEIATDGIALGRRVSWPSVRPIDGERSLILGPGYRSDVLVQANPLAPGETRHVYYVRDLSLRGANSLTFVRSTQRLAKRGQALKAMDFIAEPLGKPEFIVAQVVVEGLPVDMALPSSADLADRIPTELAPISDAELEATPVPFRTQTVSLELEERECDASGECRPCPANQDCDLAYTINGKQYTDTRPPRQLKLGTGTEWTLTGSGALHPFHIHVNPFHYDRVEPDASGQLIRARVWKDTVLVPFDGSQLKVRSRQTLFSGLFVLHCHILGHEDLGMMERVEISP